MRCAAVALALLALVACGGQQIQSPNAGDQQSALAGNHALPESYDLDPALMQLLAAELERVLDQSPPRTARARTTEYVTPDREVNGNDVLLNWQYNHTGDYDQNGEVTIGDLTPVGQHFGLTDAAANWEAGSVADGDENGEVNISDVTPIGQNFGEKFAEYVVESADSPDGPWTVVVRVPLAEGWQEPGGGRLWFEANVVSGAATAHFRVWGDGDSEDPPPVASRLQRYRTISHFMYQIQGLEDPGAVEALAATHYDALVVEPTSTFVGEEDFDTAGMVATLKASPDSRGGNKLVIAYIDVGQAEDYRTYWQPTWVAPTQTERGEPDFMVTIDPDGWSGNYVVAYWDPRWIELMISNPDSVLNQVIDWGFDGIYMDWIEAYDDEKVIQAASEENPPVDAPSAMVDFLGQLRAVAHARDPEFLVIQQNAPFLIEEATGLADVIDGLAMEDTWFLGAADVDWGDPLGGDTPQSTEGDYTTAGLLAVYPDYLAAGLPVWTVDYCLLPANAAHVYTQSPANGLIPLVTQTSLMRITETPPPSY